MRVGLPGGVPDVDTRDDLAALLEASWAERVRENREQVDRLREVPDGPDFYRSISSLFRADPMRTDDPVLDRLATEARPDETWLDVGAGAGRFALPIARRVREVVAVDPSERMLAALQEIAAEHGIANVRSILARWPMPDADRRADVVLIAHVGYDIEAIGPFVSALEAAARRRCLAVLMERQPASTIDPFWPIVHGEERVPLPALPEFIELLAARGREVSVTLPAAPGGALRHLRRGARLRPTPDMGRRGRTQGPAPGGGAARARQRDRRGMDAARTGHAHRRRRLGARGAAARARLGRESPEASRA